MIVKSLYADNLHKMKDFFIELSPRGTYFVGPNGIGKSSILEAIQLALVGYIPGTGKTNEAVYRHSSGKVMTVKVKLEEGGKIVEIVRTWKRVGNSVKTTLDITPDNYDLSQILKDVELPIFNFDEFVGMTSNQLKAWFIQFLPDSSPDVNWDEVLVSDNYIVNPELIEEFKSQMEEVLTYGGVEEVAEGNKVLKSILSCKKGELSRQQSTIQSLIYHDDIDDDLLEDEGSIRDRIKKIHLRASESSRYAECIKARDRAASELKELDVSADTLESDETYVRYASDMKDISDKFREAKEALSNLDRLKTEAEVGLAYAKSILANHSCPVLGHTCPHLETVSKECEANIVKLEADIEGYMTQTRKLESGMIQLNTSYQEKEAKVKELSYQYSRKAELEKILSTYSDIPDKVEDADELLEEAERLSDILGKIVANKRYNDLIEQLTKHKYQLEIDINTLNEWIKKTDANNLQMELMRVPFEGLENTLTEYLTELYGEPTSARFNLSSKANSFSFGIVRNDQYIPYELLSSGEQCVYTLALMIFITKHNNSNLNLILVDDIFDHLDNIRIDLLFSCISKRDDIQFIMAGVKSPDKTISDDISIIDLSI